MRSSTNRFSSSAVKQMVGIGVLIAAVIGVIMLMPHSSLFTRQAARAPPATEAERYGGEIRLAPTEDGRCRALAFDNRSGQFVDKGLMPCNSEPSTPELLGRLGTISKTFRHQ